MKDIESEKSSLLPSGDGNRRDGTDSCHRNSNSSSRCCTYSWRWGLSIFVMIEILLGYHFGVLKKTSRLFQQFNPNGMPGPYTQTQVLGFQIHTGGGPAILNGTGEMNPECITAGKRYGLLGGADEENDEPEFLCYLGLPNPMDDVRARLNIMKDAVEAAYERANQDTSVLKIFLAPEFFFRGVDGAYQFDDEGNNDCGPICTILVGLEEIVANKRYADWFFLFGSVVAYDDGDDIPDTATFDYLFYNFAPIYRGYDPEKTNYYGKRYLLPKRYTSNLDFLTPQRYINESFTKEVIDQALPVMNETLANPYEEFQSRYDIEVWEQYKDEISELGYTMIEYDWIIMDDIVMSIEICFDHFRGRALETYIADIASGSKTRIPKFSSMYDQLSFGPIPKSQAQVSIISSSGMTINPNSLALTQNGTVYLQDGLYDDDASIEWLDSTEGRIDETLGGSEAIQRRAVISSTDIHFDYNIVEFEDKYPVYNATPDAWKIALNGTFSMATYEPMIVVWEPQEIASV